MITQLPTTDGAVAAVTRHEHDEQSNQIEAYIRTFSPLPDALKLAMRNVASANQTPIVDEQTALLIQHLISTQKTAAGSTIVEVGTGVGYLTVHLAEALGHNSRLVSFEQNPDLHGQAHAFMEHLTHECVLEMRLLNPLKSSQTAYQDDLDDGIDALILGGVHIDQQEVFDQLTHLLNPNALIVAAWALRGGLVAENEVALSADAPVFVSQQRRFNRHLVASPRTRGVQLLPIGDGLLIARWRG